MKPAHPAARAQQRVQNAFSLLEVMIALGIFFMAVFTILALVSGTLRNARALQRPYIDAGMVAAQYVNTNRFSEGRVSGQFEDPLHDYSFEVETMEAATNGLLQADIVLFRRGQPEPMDKLRIFIYDPSFRSTPFSGGGGSGGRR